MFERFKLIVNWLFDQTILPWWPEGGKDGEAAAGAEAETETETTEG